MLFVSIHGTFNRETEIDYFRGLLVTFRMKCDPKDNGPRISTEKQKDKIYCMSETGKKHKRMIREETELNKSREEKRIEKDSVPDRDGLRLDYPDRYR
jgi:hypothetical protein